MAVRPPTGRRYVRKGANPSAHYPSPLTWPAGSTNIAPGAEHFFVLSLCDLSVPGTQVATVEVVVSDVTVY